MVQNKNKGKNTGADDDKAVPFSYQTPVELHIFIFVYGPVGDI